MKLAVVGLGQCGCNIADEFYAVNNYARSIFNRRIEILTDAFAINTDGTDLGGFKNIPRDSNHRILIGNITTFGHGVGKINYDATQIIKTSNSVITDTIMRSGQFHDSDAVVAIAGGGGGTGSGTIGWVIKSLKERIDKTVYAIVVLPFAFEERGDSSFAVMNTATCINTVLRYADSVFLVDNERYRKSGSNLANNIREINKEIAGNFYDLCCAGEERNYRFVGSKVIDAGDIKRSMGGISIIGRGETPLSVFRWNRSSNNYWEKIREQGSTLSALNQAQSNLSLSVQLEDARKILVLISAPKDALSISTLEEISNYLNTKSPKAVVRIGDYPRRRNEISVTLIASELTNTKRLENLFLQADELFKKRQEINEEIVSDAERVRSFGRNLPLLD